MRRRRFAWRGVGPLAESGGGRLSGREHARWRDAHTWDPERDGSLVLVRDPTPAEWIEPLLVPESFEVRMTAPQGYEAYARIFFPFVGRQTEISGEVRQELLTWSEVARRHGHVAHALMEKETISQHEGGRSHGGTTYNSLSPEQSAALLPILTRHTSSATAFFLLWEGWGDLNERVFRPDTPRVRQHWRDLYLLRGRLDAYEELPHDPSYFWPEDRSWCLCSDCDFEWAYLGASAACIEEILAVPVLDAFATRPENPARVGMDVVNDPEGRVPRP